MMERLTNYYADASLLEDEDTYGVYGYISTESFQILDNCTRSIFKALSDTMPPEEVICPDTALPDFSLSFYPGRIDHIIRCLGVCATSLQERTPTALLRLHEKRPTPSMERPLCQPFQAHADPLMRPLLTSLINCSPYPLITLRSRC